MTSDNFLFPRSDTTNAFYLGQREGRHWIKRSSLQELDTLSNSDEARGIMSLQSQTWHRHSPWSRIRYQNGEREESSGKTTPPFWQPLFHMSILITMTREVAIITWVFMNHPQRQVCEVVDVEVRLLTPLLTRRFFIPSKANECGGIFVAFGTSFGHSQDIRERSQAKFEKKIKLELRRNLTSWWSSSLFGLLKVRRVSCWGNRDQLQLACASARGFHYSLKRYVNQVWTSTAM